MSRRRPRHTTPGISRSRQGFTSSSATGCATTVRMSSLRVLGLARLAAFGANGSQSAAAAPRAGISRATTYANASSARRAAVKIAERSARSTCSQAPM